eukprot:7431189-Pyramimonas_sp.AAC.1
MFGLYEPCLDPVQFNARRLRYVQSCSLRAHLQLGAFEADSFVHVLRGKNFPLVRKPVKSRLQTDAVFGRL